MNLRRPRATYLPRTVNVPQDEPPRAPARKTMSSFGRIRQIRALLCFNVLALISSCFKDYYATYSRRVDITKDIGETS